MKAIDFVSLVNEMREAQKKYFRTRTPWDLDKSKDIEKKVDDILYRYNNFVNKTNSPTLFEK